MTFALISIGALIAIIAYSLGKDQGRREGRLAAQIEQEKVAMAEAFDQLEKLALDPSGGARVWIEPDADPREGRV